MYAMIFSPLLFAYTATLFALCNAIKNFIFVVQRSNGTHYAYTSETGKFALNNKTV
jgi:hypothetical protein